MNWDNKDNKDPWGNRSNGNDQDFDDLLKRFSSILFSFCSTLMKEPCFISPRNGGQTH